MPSLGSTEMLGKNSSGKSRTARWPVSSSTVTTAWVMPFWARMARNIVTGSSMSAASHFGTSLNM